eukprot:scaffold49438_cov56-Phaeocystis_antarctica.AAC.2
MASPPTTAASIPVGHAAPQPEAKSGLPYSGTAGANHSHLHNQGQEAQAEHFKYIDHRLKSARARDMKEHSHEIEPCYMRVKYETWSQSVSPHLTCDSLTCDYRTPTSDLVAKPAKPLVGRPSVRACVPRTARRRLATRLQAGRCHCRPGVGVCFDLLSVCLYLVGSGARSTRPPPTPPPPRAWPAWPWRRAWPWPGWG